MRWTAGGVALELWGSGAFWPTITSDGASGAIVTWQDYRGGYMGPPGIYAQRLNSAGVVQWAANGVALQGIEPSTSAKYPTITSDAVGGAIVTWYDKRSGVNDIYAQRVNSTGAVQWTEDGVPLRTIEGTRRDLPQYNLGWGGRRHSIMG